MKGVKRIRSAKCGPEIRLFIQQFKMANKYKVTGGVCFNVANLPE